MNKTIAEFLNGDTYSIRYTFNGDIAYKCNEEVRKYIRNQNKEIERLNKELTFERQIKKEAIEYIKNIPDDEFLESEYFTELLFILGKVGSDKYGIMDKKSR